MSHCLSSWIKQPPIIQYECGEARSLKGIPSGIAISGARDFKSFLIDIQEVTDITNKESFQKELSEYIR